MAFVVAAIWKAKAGEEARIREVIKIMTRIARKEPGVIYFQAQVSPSDPTKFFLYEQYKTSADYDAHKATDAFKTHVVGHALKYLELREVTTYETVED